MPVNDVSTLGPFLLVRCVNSHPSVQTLAAGIDDDRHGQLGFLQDRPLLVLGLLIHLDQHMAECCYAMIGTALVEARIDADVCATALPARPHAADWRSEMLLNPFLALQERTLGSWPTTALLIADDVVADADNLVLLETCLEKVDG